MPLSFQCRGLSIDGWETNLIQLINDQLSLARDPTPPTVDIAIAKEIIAIAEPLYLIIHDPVIVGRQSHTSLKGLGLI
ncbi:MAG: hypothetical protein ABJN26_03345 [Stappiaceae bacterium]